MSNVELLRAIDIFGQVSEEDLLRIAALLKEERISGDSIVFRQGDPGDALYIVLSGRVRATVADAMGKERELGTFSDGQSFGEMALLTGEPYSSTVRASSDARLLVLRKEDFDDFLTRNVQVMLQTMKVIAQRQATADPRGSVVETDEVPTSPQRVTLPTDPGGGVAGAYEVPTIEEVESRSLPVASRESVMEVDSAPATEGWASRSLSADPGEAVVEAGQTGPSGRVFTVFSPKGGVGKTTVAVNLAVALAQTHPGAVALLDLSLTFGHSAILLNLSPRSSLSAAAVEMPRDMEPQELDYYLSTHPGSGLRVMVGALRPEDGETVTGELSKAAIELLRRRFAYLVVDTESYFSDPVLAALELSDRILVLASPEITALRDLRECQRIFDKVVRIPKARILYLMNYLFPFKLLSKGQFEDALGQGVFAELPHGEDGPARAALRGEPLVSVQPGSPLGRSLQRLAAQLASERIGVSTDGRQERRRGFFR